MDQSTGRTAGDPHPAGNASEALGFARAAQGLNSGEPANWLTINAGEVVVGSATDLSSNLERKRARAANTKSFTDKAHAARTKTEYTKHVRLFVEWCATEQCTAIPAEPATVAEYIAARARVGTSGRPWKPTTIAIALSAIHKAHKLAGLPSPRHEVLVTETLAGIRRDRGVRPCRVAAAGVKVTRKLVENLPSTPIGVRDRALLLLAFFGAFRRSELVSLNVDDLSFDDEGLRVLLRRSKTDQEGKGRWKDIPFGACSETCPIRALQRWLETAGIAEGAVFRAVSRHGIVGQRLHPGDVARIVKRAARSAGLDASRFSGHSPRRGLTTDALKEKKDPGAIQQHVGWSSGAMLDVYREGVGRFGEDNPARGLGL